MFFHFLDFVLIFFLYFVRFSSDEVSSQNQVKASVQRKIRQSIADEYPGLEPVLDDLLPKKSPLIVVKCQNHLNLVVVNNVPLFFNIRDGPYMPTLRLLHQYPNIMKKLQVDRGAIKFVLSGANIMCPGLTSPGGALDDEVDAETPVAIMAEGKQHALAIGFTKMSAKDIKTINKGIGVDNMHYLNDGLWKHDVVDNGNNCNHFYYLHYADGAFGLRFSPRKYAVVSFKQDRKSMYYLPLQCYSDFLSPDVAEVVCVKFSLLVLTFFPCTQQKLILPYRSTV
ncbi:hypothetical protein POTOM_043738 [Populus tomentosa]|uniref:PUA domain-containing protein n=1 Tax=Populus tomentosa TaxID=118781 RepID=A0A8X7YIY5_POPTO|nr:hypothetical protein POTOM_043738 [Populus tomentosa]